tara:strand:- start:1471 stop:2079 length:609 start_codon:yes stop_codon:yes gene_type:complete
MYALVENNQFVKLMRTNKGFTLNGLQYPKEVFTLWTTEERKAIGIYPVRTDTTNKKDEAWYINTNITYVVSGDEVVGSYGTATAKEIEDRNEVNDDGTPMLDSDGNQVVTKGLKTIKKEMINNQCAGILAPSDWMVVKATETETTMDSGWKTWRASVRTKCNSMQTQIDNASDVDALAALFTYTEQEDGTVTKPLGEFPVKE